MAIDVNKLIITQVDQITAFNNANELEFILDELTATTISNSEEKTDITGKGGRKIASLKKNKAVKITGTNALVVGGAIAAITGTEVESGTYKVRFTDIIVVNNDKCETKDTAVGTAGAEIGTIYVKNANGSLGRTLSQNATASKNGEFAYDPATKEITFFEGDLKNGEEVVAFYDVEVESAKISNDSEKYGKTLKLYIDITAQDNCDNVYHGQFIIQRADFNGTFDLAIGSEPTTQAFEAESLAGGCTGSSNLWDLIIFQ